VHEFFQGSTGTMYGHDQAWLESENECRWGEGMSLFHPFSDQEEWELALCLMTSGISANKMDELLKLPIVHSTSVSDSMNS